MALAESQKNASLLAEYHDLYELQRKRLETQVFMLAEEKDVWSTAAYSLALKVSTLSVLSVLCICAVLLEDRGEDEAWSPPLAKSETIVWFAASLFRAELGCVNIIYS